MLTIRMKIDPTRAFIRTDRARGNLLQVPQVHSHSHRPIHRAMDNGQEPAIAAEGRNGYPSEPAQVLDLAIVSKAADAAIALAVGARIEGVRLVQIDPVRISLPGVPWPGQTQTGPGPR